MHAFNGPLSGTIRVSRYQKGKTDLDFTEARDSEWQWHQLGHMQVCNSLQTDNHANTPSLSFLKCQMPFLPPNQQCQSTTQSTLLLRKPQCTVRCVNQRITWVNLQQPILVCLLSHSKILLLLSISEFQLKVTLG